MSFEVFWTCFSVMMFYSFVLINMWKCFYYLNLIWSSCWCYWVSRQYVCVWCLFYFVSICSRLLGMVWVLSVQKVSWELKFDGLVGYHWSCSYEVEILCILLMIGCYLLLFWIQLCLVLVMWFVRTKINVCLEA
jgi:hypothetical protein